MYSHMNTDMQIRNLKLVLYLNRCPLYVLHKILLTPAQNLLALASERALVYLTETILSL